jgi:hypothetical protein
VAGDLLPDGRVFVLFVDPLPETGAVDVSDAACAVAGRDQLAALIIIGLKADAALDVFGRLFGGRG